MDHSYQLSRPSIETIIDYCNDLLADEKLTVFEFGENCDLVLHIYKVKLLDICFFLSACRQRFAKSLMQ